MSRIDSPLRHGEPTLPSVLLALWFLVFSAPVWANSGDLEIVGWVERAVLLDPLVKLKAKLDSGAETSSLDVEVIKKFRKGGKRWVRFRLRDRETGKDHVIVRERVRTVAIVQHNGDRQARPVVKMDICIAGRILETDVSLIDRSEFNYPLLLGRTVLSEFALIDPGNTFLSEPDCHPSLADRSANP